MSEEQGVRGAGVRAAVQAEGVDGAVGSHGVEQHGAPLDGLHLEAW